MVSRSIVDLVSRIPGDYIIELGSYPSYGEFQRDRLLVLSLCEKFDDFFSVVEDPRTRRLEAFFVHISTLSHAMKRFG